MHSFVPPRSGAADRKPADRPRRPVGDRRDFAPRVRRSGEAGRSHGGHKGAPPRPSRPADALPERLQAVMEAMSGLSLAEVVVHRNCAEPARMGAAAFTKGSRINLAPGEERHLAHEAWHVVQQKQGRVAPIMQMKGGASVNDDPVLEREADAMGAIALQAVSAPLSSRFSITAGVASRDDIAADRQPPSAGSAVVQRVEAWELRELKDGAWRLKDSGRLKEFAATVDRMLERGSEAGLSYGELHRLANGLAGWWRRPDDLESAVSKLAAAKTDDKFIQVYAEVHNALDRGSKAGFDDQGVSRPTDVVINAVKGKDYEVRPGLTVRIDPVDEADALYHGHDGKVHLEEVKATPQAFFDKLVTRPQQFENMISWRDQAPGRVVAVRIHLNGDFGMLDRIERYEGVRDQIASLIQKGMEITVNGEPIQKLLKPPFNPHAMDSMPKALDPSTGLPPGSS
jgi:hypothetical protein